MVQTVKNLPAVQKTRVKFLSKEDPWGREWLPSCLEIHGQSSLADYSPKCHNELDTIEQLALSLQVGVRKLL